MSKIKKKMNNKISEINFAKNISDLTWDIRTRTLKRLEEMPSGFFNWQLNNTAMSFADIIQHLINVDVLFLEMIQSSENQFTWKMGTDEPHLQIDKSTYEAMIEELKKLQNQRKEIITTLTIDKLNQEIKNDKGEKMTLWSFIMLHVVEHEIYHRGQISIYLKILKGETTFFLSQTFTSG